MALAFYRLVVIFTFSDQYDIDGKVLGNAARYINHSCAALSQNLLRGA